MQGDQHQIQADQQHIDEKIQAEQIVESGNGNIDVVATAP